MGDEEDRQIEEDRKKLEAAQEQLRQQVNGASTDELRERDPRAK